MAEPVPGPEQEPTAVSSNCTSPDMPDGASPEQLQDEDQAEQEDPKSIPNEVCNCTQKRVLCTIALLMRHHAVVL